jgi:hypothetical protein
MTELQRYLTLNRSVIILDRNQKYSIDNQQHWYKNALSKVMQVQKLMIKFTFFKTDPVYFFKLSNKRRMSNKQQQKRTCISFIKIYEMKLYNPNIAYCSSFEFSLVTLSKSLLYCIQIHFNNVLVSISQISFGFSRISKQRNDGGLTIKWIRYQLMYMKEKAMTEIQNAESSESQKLILWKPKTDPALDDSIFRKMMKKKKEKKWKNSKKFVCTFK